jgi:hypothetical protein
MRVLLFALWTMAASAQTLPPGKARAIVVRTCGECHSLDVVAAARGNKSRWQAVVREMVTDGAKLSKTEVPQVVDYLARNFPDGPGRRR